MVKSYITYAQQIRDIIQEHSESAVFYVEKATNLNRNRNYSDTGKREIVRKTNEEIAALNQKFSDRIRDVVRKFCDDYTLQLKEDGKDHDLEINNALKVIDMTGYSITADLFRQVLDPLKGSYKALKLIHDVLEAKEPVKTILPDMGYSDDVKHVIADYLGFNDEITDYMSEIERIRAVIDYPVLVEYRIMDESFMTSVPQYAVVDQTRYSVFTLADSIESTGRLFDGLSCKYPIVYAKAV